MRIGLGCMRLSTERARDEALSLDTLRAAIAAGIVIFDTARAYALDESDLGHNERLLARAFSEHEPAPPASPRIITKCGMRRDNGAWIPDGRARRIIEDARESAAALGRPIDLLLLHAPDPRTPLTTAARALARTIDDGLATRIGVSNVSRRQLEEISAHAPISAVEIALGAYDDLAIRSGVVTWCLDRNIEILAHAPLGGPKRAARLARDPLLKQIAKDTPALPTPIETFLAYLLAAHPALVPIVGARNVATVESLARATGLTLTEDQLLQLDVRFPLLGSLRRPSSNTASTNSTSTTREVVLMMGIPGAGKSRAAEALVARGYERLNRDTLGGTLRGIARRLDDLLRAGAERFVLDNTYVTRATRNDVIRIANAHQAAVRCVFFDTPPHEAQINVVLRMINRFGQVLEPKDIARRAREDAAALGPSAILRMIRDLEPPATDEGFVAIEMVPFTREHGEHERPGLAIHLDALGPTTAELLATTPPDTACLLFAWRPGLDDAALERARAEAARLADATSRIVDLALCTHPAGPPICWCRPPLPGLWLEFANRHRVDPRRSTLHASSAADRNMARAIGITLA